MRALKRQSVHPSRCVNHNARSVQNLPSCTGGLLERYVREKKATVVVVAPADLATNVASALTVLAILDFG